MIACLLKKEPDSINRDKLLTFLPTAASPTSWSKHAR
ncbi:hypothetical protein Bealeia2_02076 (plasmid) [Candidatus Bealeia paramacronuclearis]|nr:hypothetical protein [Candidatus Bealeia paramacronuclearis]